MQTVALGWLVFRLTGSALMLGTVTLLSALPAGPMVLWGGVLADRFPRRTIIAVAQTLAMAQAVALAVLTALGTIRIWHVVVLSLVYGLASVLDEGARQSIIAELVLPADLVNASDLVVTARMIARATGPALGGLVLAGAGEAACFALNGLSFAAMIAVALAVRPLPGAALPELERGRATSVRGAVAEAARYALGPSRAGQVIGLVSINNFFLLALVPLLPAFVGEVLKAGSLELGWLNAAFGTGALVGAALIVMLGGRMQRRGAFSLATLAAPMAAAAFAATRWMPASAAVLAGLGALVIGQTTLGNGLLQAGTPEAMRSRIMSFNALFTYGATRLGALVLGAAVEWLGFSQMVVAGALVCLVVSAPGLYSLRARPR
jgi:MFS family permease